MDGTRTREASERQHTGRHRGAVEGAGPGEAIGCPGRRAQRVTSPRPAGARRRGRTHAGRVAGSQDELSTSARQTHMHRHISPGAGRRKRQRGHGIGCHGPGVAGHGSRVTGQMGAAGDASIAKRCVVVQRSASPQGSPRPGGCLPPHARPGLARHSASAGTACRLLLAGLIMTHMPTGSAGTGPHTGSTPGHPRCQSSPQHTAGPPARRLSATLPLPLPT